MILKIILGLVIGGAIGYGLYTISSHVGST